MLDFLLAYLFKISHWKFSGVLWVFNFYLSHTNINAKVFQQSTYRPDSKIHQKIIDHNQVDFTTKIQGLFKISKSINIIYHINIPKDKTT